MYFSKANVRYYAWYPCFSKIAIYRKWHGNKTCPQIVLTNSEVYFFKLKFIIKVKLQVACGTWFYFLDLLEIYRTSRLYTETLGMLKFCWEVLKYQILRFSWSFYGRFWKKKHEFCIKIAVSLDHFQTRLCQLIFSHDLIFIITI